MASRRAALLPVVVFPLLAIILLSHGAHGLSVLESQETVTMTIERGSTQSFPLILQNAQEKSTIKAAGDASPWISFWEEGSGEYETYPGQAYILVIIDVPSDTDLGEYDAEIRSDSTVLSEIRLKVTLELSDVKSYVKLSDVDKEVGTLKDKVGSLSTGVSDLKSEVSVLETRLSEKMEEVYEYQKNLTEVENENEQLSEEVASLRYKLASAEQSNEELNQFTGMLVGAQIPGMFLGGLILGIIIVTTIINREMVKKKLKEKTRRKASQGTAPQKKEEPFRYSWKS